MSRRGLLSSSTSALMPHASALEASEHFLPAGAEAERTARLLAKGNHHLGGEALEEAPPWTRPSSGAKAQPLRTCYWNSSHKFGARDRGAAAELKLIGRFIGIETHVGPQKLHAGGLQNKVCWKPE